MAKTKLQNKINGKDEKKGELDSLRAQVARVLADYDNLQKRTEAEKVMWVKFSAQRIVEQFLPILDVFENAQNHLKDVGLGIGITQFKEALKREGLEEIGPKEGEMFNENLHEAVESVVDDAKTGLIAGTVVNGWKFKDGPVIRYAKVRAYTKSS